MRGRLRAGRLPTSHGTPWCPTTPCEFTDGGWHNTSTAQGGGNAVASSA